MTDPDELPMESSFPVLLTRARTAVSGYFREALRKHDLTDAQWRVLSCVYLNPMIDVAEIARLTDLLGPSVSRILKDFEGRSLLKRVADGRHTLVALMPQGQALFRDAKGDFNDARRDIEQTLGGANAEHVRQALYLLINTLSPAQASEGEAD